ncbi:hypothetical protein KP509_30G052000 [Ceratopteris richardii]|nr:hypothetical protein KP509_30G052000 [Ceratopteris richardii]
MASRTVTISPTPGEGVDGLDYLPGLTILGSGYDVLNGYYADPRSCKANLFVLTDTTDPNDLLKVTITRSDNSEVAYAIPKVVTLHPNPTSSSYVSTGRSIEEFSSSLNSYTKIEGSYIFFSSAISTSIGSQTAQSLDKEFSMVQDDLQYYTLQLPPANNLASYLQESVRKAIDESTALTQLFDDYGTHYVAGLIMGGSATYTCSTSKTKYQSSFDLKVVAEMSYKKVVGSISDEQNMQYENEIKSFQEHSETKVVTRGGAPALGGDAYVKNPQAWRDSVERNLTFANFLSPGLIGIWNLASTAKRKQELLDHYSKYCQEKQQTFELPEPLLRARRVQLSKIQFTDQGSGAKASLAVAIPNVGSEWYYLGQVAFKGEGEVSGQTVVVQEVVKNSGVLTEVDRWDAIWNDVGSGKRNDYSLWHGIAGDPVDYYVVGDFFVGGRSSETAPTAEETKGIRAVHRRCLVEGAIGNQVWNDAGSKANSDGAVWEIVPAGNENIDMTNVKATFASVKSRSAKPQGPVYLLKRSAVVFDS